MSEGAPSRADSRQGLLRAASSLLEAAGNPDLADPATLVGRALGLSRADLQAHPEAPVEAEAAARALDWARRHAAGEPLAYLEGSVGFRRLELAVDPRVLVPRADSEVVVEAALAALAEVQAPRLIDVGTGSGCLLLALLDEVPQAEGIGVDLSPDALEVARANAQACGLAERASFREGSFLGSKDEAPFAEGVDLIVSNPPYVVAGEALGPGVAEHEPHLALFVPDDDPLSPYAAILARAPAFLRPGGAVVFEVGAGRAAAVAALGEALGFRHLQTRADLGGIERAVVLRR